MADSGFLGLGGIGRGAPVNQQPTSSQSAGPPGGGFSFGGFGSAASADEGGRGGGGRGQRAGFGVDRPSDTRPGGFGFSGADGDSGAGRGGGARSNRCYNCGEEGHTARDCSNDTKCFRCKQPGHTSKDCTSERPPRDPDKPAPVTYVPEELTDETLLNDSDLVIHSGSNFQNYLLKAEVQVSGRTAEIARLANFKDAMMNQQIYVNVKKSEYEIPTPIQSYSIPQILEGHDVMGCAQTGSGKTAAYLLPILSTILSKSLSGGGVGEQVQAPAAIILAPTRELAVQIQVESRRFSQGTVVTSQVVYGGVSVRYQLDQLRKGCDVLIGTPGRLTQFVGEGHVSLRCVRFLVLDEADRMLDMGFEPEIRRLVQNAEMPPKGDRQTLMFSATFPSEIQTLAKDFLREYTFLTVGPIGGANQDIVQDFAQVAQHEKKDKVLDLLEDDMKQYQREGERYNRKTLVFVERKRTADFVASLISQAKLPSTSIHGDRDQQQREEALRDFKRGRCAILVATAVAARGLDIVGVDHVINYDLPQTIEDYVHRIGRTGRVGNPGRAMSFFDDAVDQPLVDGLVKVLSEANQVVPEWMQGGGVSASGGSFAGARSYFGASGFSQEGDAFASNADSFKPPPPANEWDK